MRSFLDQLLHYFARDHVGPAISTIVSPAAWRGVELRDNPTWIEKFSDEEIAELEESGRCLVTTGQALESLTREDAPLPGLECRLRSWREILSPASGRGFLLARGLPVERWGSAVSEAVFWCIGLHLGEPGGQNPDNDVLGHVRDEGDDLTRSTGRAYRTRAAIRFHCDAADVVGLFCLRAATGGGASRIVSSASVFNALLIERPECAARLFETFTLDARNDAGNVRHTPVQPCCFDGAVLRTFYHSDYYRSAPRHPGVELDGLGLATLDAWEEIAEREDMRLDMNLEPGDMQWLSNHTVTHARTSYEESGEPADRRHLLRLWLSLA
jgi:hypothetical protein